jgi:hypothetical protein
LHPNPLLFRIDFNHLLANPDIDVLFFLKLSGGARNQIIDVVDDTADVIRNSSCGVRGIITPLESDNLNFRIVATGLGRCAHAGSIPANDKKAFFAH